MKFDLERHAPPGFPVDTEKMFFQVIWGLSLLWSAGFVLRYLDARGSLYYTVGNRRLLDATARIAPFSELLGSALAGFGLLALAMLGLIGWHYSYYHQGAKAIYLMRRLPDRGLLHRQCVTLPLLGAAVCLASALVLLVLYILIYRFFTPSECLPQSLLWGMTLITTGGI